MVWKQKDINKALFDYKGIRQLNLIANGKEYVIEVIAYSFGKENYSTEIWIVGKNDKIKLVIEIINKQVTDKECLQIITDNISDWVYDYESSVRRNIL